MHHAIFRFEETFRIMKDLTLGPFPPETEHSIYLNTLVK